MLVRDSLRPVIIGLAGGLVLALLLGRVVESALYGVSGHDPVAVIAAVAVLLAAASAAILIPARRAARVSPSQMLRES
jgi:ABC-type antimicrobial peptide transport system permease subunit